MENKVRKILLISLFVLLAVISSLIMFKPLIRYGIVNYDKYQHETHLEKMSYRDSYLDSLYNILSGIRFISNADRVLYFEYHNSKENLLGVPFKYVDLITQVNKLNVPYLDYNEYSNINTGSIITLCRDLRKDTMLACTERNLIWFKHTYPYIYQVITQEDTTRSYKFLICNTIVVNEDYFNVDLDLFNQPIGFFIIEWIDNKDREIVDNVAEKLTRKKYLELFSKLYSQRKETNVKIFKDGYN